MPNKICKVLCAAVIFMLFTFLLSACNDNSDLPENQSPENQTDSNTLTRTENSAMTYTLPTPETDGEMSVETALQSRRSQRNFQDKELSAEQLSQILWAAYGITSQNGFRTAPSAGALYPLEVYAIVGNVAEIEPGVYRYIADKHEIVKVADGDVRVDLSAAALNQTMVADAPLSIFYTAVFERITGRYGERGVNYTYIEAGHSSQNVYLQAQTLGLGTCAIGAFMDSKVIEVLSLPDNETPLYLMPVGYYER